MPQFSNLVINDGKATPVAHTFKPRDINQGVATAVESTGVPLGDNRITFSQNRTNTGRVKPTVKFTFPIVQTETLNGVSRPVVVRTAYVDVSFNFDGTSSAAERQDVMAMVSNAFASSQTAVKSYLVDLEGMY